MSTLGHVLRRTSLNQMYHRRGSGDGTPSLPRLKILAAGGSCPGRFFETLLKKKGYFNAIGSHFVCLQSQLKELDF